jgi:hypothetical protein
MRRVGDFFKTYPPGLRFLVRIELARRKIEREPASRSYSDLGLESIAETDQFSSGTKLSRNRVSARF